MRRPSSPRSRGSPITIRQSAPTSRSSTEPKTDGTQSGSAGNPAYGTASSSASLAGGVSAAQVQVVWLKEAIAGEARRFPKDAKALQADLRAILRVMRLRYPNLRLGLPLEPNLRRLRDHRPQSGACGLRQRLRGSRPDPGPDGGQGQGPVARLGAVPLDRWAEGAAARRAASGRPATTNRTTGPIRRSQVSRRSPRCSSTSSRPTPPRGAGSSPTRRGTSVAPVLSRRAEGPCRHRRCGRRWACRSPQVIAEAGSPGHARRDEIRTRSSR